MGTPLGDFIRTKRDSIEPDSLGLPERGRRRSPGLRRSDLATRSGISVEYLTRIEQGRDRNPSVAVLNALADGLSLNACERQHLRYLAKISGGECVGETRPEPSARTVRPAVLQTLNLLEPGIAVVTNRLGDLLAHTNGCAAVLGETGLLDGEEPNLTRYVFTDPRARTLFADWADIADRQAFDLWMGPAQRNVDWLTGQLAPLAGEEFTRRLNQHQLPPGGVLRLNHPSGGELRLIRETLELGPDAQQIMVLLPADEQTAQAIERLRRSHRPLRVIS